MSNRWLPPRAAALGLLIGVVVFLTLHLVLDASVLGSAVWLLVGGAIAAALVLHVRRVELLRTRQAQGYFVSAMMIAGITLAWLPPGTVGEALQTGTGTIEVSDQERSVARLTGLYPDASEAAQQLVVAAQSDIPLADTRIHSIVLTSEEVAVLVLDPASNVVREYSMGVDGEIDDVAVSSIDAQAVNEFTLSALQVADLNELFDSVVASHDVPVSSDDVLGITSPQEGAAPVITIAFGAPHERIEVYADATGAIQDGP